MFSTIFDFISRNNANPLLQNPEIHVQYQKGRVKSATFQLNNPLSGVSQSVEDAQRYQSRWGRWKENVPTVQSRILLRFQSIAPSKLRKYSPCQKTVNKSKSAYNEPQNEPPCKKKLEMDGTSNISYIFVTTKSCIVLNGSDKPRDYIGFCKNRPTVL